MVKSGHSSRVSAGSSLHRVYANLKIALLQRLQVSHHRLGVGAGCPTHSRVSNEWDLETRGSADRRDLFVQVLEQERQSYHWVVIGIRRHAGACSSAGK